MDKSVIIEKKIEYEVNHFNNLIIITDNQEYKIIDKLKKNNILSSYS